MPFFLFVNDYFIISIVRENNYYAMFCFSLSSIRVVAIVFEFVVAVVLASLCLCDSSVSARLSVTMFF
jgi:hypothetical protein